MKNIFDDVPKGQAEEQFLDLLKADKVRIERIVSCGQSSPAEGWYDQDEHEWVMVLKGSACIEFEDAQPKTLLSGDFINIPAGVKHKVAWTQADTETIWLAVFYTE